MKNVFLVQFRNRSSSLIQHRYLTACTNQDQPDFTTIYRWPLIRHFRFIARLKTYQTGVMILSLPPLTYLYKMGDVTDKSVICGCLAAGGAVTILSILSYGFSKIVGQIKYNQQSEMLQVSYLSFFGNKRTIEVKVEEMVPFDDLHQYGRRNAMQKLEFGKYSFYYSLKYGSIIDSESFKRVLSIT